MICFRISESIIKLLNMQSKILNDILDFLQFFINICGHTMEPIPIEIALILII